MFSSSKAVIAGTLVFTIWGATLISQPFAQPASAAEASAPSAAEDVAPTWVTGTIQHVDGSCSEIGSTPGGSSATHSAYRCTQTWTSSDPRLSGSAVRAWAEDTYQTAEGVVSVGTGARYLSNEGGGWACLAGYLGRGASPSLEALADDTFTCTGSGGYRGLSAIIVNTPHADDFGDDFVGLIFPGDIPPAPGAAVE